MHGRICGHVFLAELLTDTQPIVKKRHEEPAVRAAILSGKSMPSYHTTIKHRYILEVFRTLTNISSLVERVGEAEFLLSVFPLEKTLVKRGLTRDKWIDYHLACFSSSLVSIFDSCLVASNEVYMLGYPERLCTLDSITNNRKVRGDPLVPALKALDKQLSAVKARRNVELHRGQRADVDMLLGSGNAHWYNQGMGMLQRLRSLDEAEAEILDYFTTQTISKMALHLRQ